MECCDGEVRATSIDSYTEGVARLAECLQHVCVAKHQQRLHCTDRPAIPYDIRREEENASFWTDRFWWECEPLD